MAGDLADVVAGRCRRGARDCPLLPLWSLDRSWRLSGKQTIEAVVMACCVLLTGATVFGVYPRTFLRNEPIEFLCLPPLLWAAFRFSPRETSTAVVLLFATALRGTWLGQGPFNNANQNVSLMLLAIFMDVMSVMTLCVATVVKERQRMMEQALRTSESRFWRLVQSNIIGFMIVDGKGDILEANDAFLSMLGYTRTDLALGLVGGPG